MEAWHEEVVEEASFLAYHHPEAGLGEEAEVGGVVTEVGQRRGLRKLSEVEVVVATGQDLGLWLAS